MRKDPGITYSTPYNYPGRISKVLRYLNILLTNEENKVNKKTEKNLIIYYIFYLNDVSLGIFYSVSLVKIDLKIGQINGWFKPKSVF